MKISEIYEFLNKLSPFDLQEKWDNSGLIVGSMQDSFDNIYITLDIDKKVLKKAKGYYGARSKVYRVAKQAVIKAGQYAYRDRRHRRRQFRRLWIVRINAEARNNGLSYSQFINGLNKAGVEIDRKILSDIAIFDKDAFAKIADQAKAGLAQK